VTRVAELEAAVGVEGLSGAERDLGRFDAAVTGTARNIDQRVAGMGPRLSKMGSNLTKFVTLPVTVGFGLALKEAGEAERVARQSEAVLKSTGNVAGVTATGIDHLATSISNKTAIDDEQIASAENMLLTFKKITNNTPDKIFDRTTRAIVDTAAGFAALHGTEVDVSSATIQIGKALNDPIKGLTALTRVGIQFSQQQKDQIAMMVYFGDTAGAQKIILRELESQFKGSGEAGATGFAKFKVELQNFAEEAGTKAMPIARDFLGVASDLMDTFLSMPDWAQELALGGAAAGAALGPFLKLGAGVANLVGGMSRLSGVSKGLSGMLSGGGGALAGVAVGAGLGLVFLEGALSSAAEHERIHQQHIEDLTAAITEQGGKVREATAAWVEHNFLKELTSNKEGREFVNQMLLAGGSIEGLTEAMRQGPEAVNAYTQSYVGLGDAAVGGIFAVNSVTSQTREASKAIYEGTRVNLINALSHGRVKDAMTILTTTTGTLHDRLVSVAKEWKANVGVHKTGEEGLDALIAKLKFVGGTWQVLINAHVNMDKNPFMPAASGGPRSGLTLVGEEGPELVNLPNGSYVHTAAQTRNFLMPAASMSTSNGAGQIVHKPTVIIVRDFDEAQAELARIAGPDAAHQTRKLSGSYL
jgi:hypothetical protein